MLMHNASVIAHTDGHVQPIDTVLTLLTGDGKLVTTTPVSLIRTTTSDARKNKNKKNTNVIGNTYLN